jgi:hypothetical protein
LRRQESTDPGDRVRDINRSKGKTTSLKEVRQVFSGFRKVSSLEILTLLMASTFLRNNKQDHFLRVMNCTGKFRRLPGIIKGPLEVSEISNSKVRPFSALVSILDSPSHTATFIHSATKTDLV